MKSKDVSVSVDLGKDDESRIRPEHQRNASEKTLIDLGSVKTLQRVIARRTFL